MKVRRRGVIGTSTKDTAGYFMTHQFNSATNKNAMVFFAHRVCHQVIRALGTFPPGGHLKLVSMPGTDHFIQVIEPSFA
jgi:hypothetical protein